ncbi:MAG: hypothetical protein JW754_05910 [Candidatus Aenigmarchaeota archaeon]|nr:hypothetical protein [Candidatus Aenigmarchaeota archaeon]
MSDRMKTLEEQAMKLDIKGVILTLIISSFGFVAALFWRDAIRELILKFVPESQGITFYFAAAIIATVIAVIVIYILSRFLKEEETTKK